MRKVAIATAQFIAYGVIEVIGTVLMVGIVFTIVSHIK